MELRCLNCGKPIGSTDYCDYCGQKTGSVISGVFLFFFNPIIGILYALSTKKVKTQYGIKLIFKIYFIIILLILILGFITE